MAKDASPSDPTRRGFLDLFLGLCGAITAAAASIPALVYLWPVTKKGPGSDRAVVAEAADLAPWESVTVLLAGKAVIVLRAGDELVAFSAVCTHLGCNVQWDESRRSFLCPCHAATFDADGQVVDGPPPTPLRKYNVTEAGGRVYISEA